MNDVLFDHALWHKANQICRGDKVHNLKIAMACYHNSFQDAKRTPHDPDKRYRLAMWQQILADRVNMP